MSSTQSLKFKQSPKHHLPRTNRLLRLWLAEGAAGGENRSSSFILCLVHPTWKHGTPKMWELISVVIITLLGLGPRWADQTTEWTFSMSFYFCSVKDMMTLCWFVICYTVSFFSLSRHDAMNHDWYCHMELKFSRCQKKDSDTTLSSERWRREKCCPQYQLSQTNGWLPTSVNGHPMRPLISFAATPHPSRQGKRTNICAS